jgi:hypothetical protein
MASTASASEVSIVTLTRSASVERAGTETTNVAMASMQIEEEIRHMALLISKPPY